MDESTRKNKSSSSFEFAPLRTLNDFILSGARFQLPNLKRFEKWNYRIEQNLTYYQSNYFLLFLLIFIFYWNFHPLEVIIGMASAGICYGIQQIDVNRHSFVLWVFSKCLGGYIFVKSIRSILVLGFGLLLPIIMIYIHATLRMRNFQNKLSNQAEMAGLVKTPMGIFLRTLKNKCDIWVKK